MAIKRILVVGVISTAALVSSAHAQTASSNCYWASSLYHCDTTVQPQAGGIDPSLPLRASQGVFTYGDIVRQEQERRQRQAEIDAMRAQQQRFAQQQSDAQELAARQQLSLDVHQAVGEYLHAGRCQEAVDFALKYGEIDLATQALSFCAASPPVQAAPVQQPAPTPAPESNQWGGRVLCITCRR